ncbi:hypothetical protein ACIHCQ_01670 [Streptomyces sp. NPDC052236]|uniref:hypothetical protein n=1 Tax=Streptomyces sp. NPDC052236 TaxID=3365686 RepID=UPI0037D590B5
MKTEKAVKTEKTVLRSSLDILATATATHGTGRSGDIPLPRLSGFVESSFSPLAYEVSRQCLTERPGDDPDGSDGSRTAVALASLMGDTTTADLASRRMVSGRVHNPLLFMQATANSVLGYVSREFGITGQMFSLSTLDDPVTELLAMAELLLEDPGLDRVLVLGVELTGMGAPPAEGQGRVAAAYRELAAETGRPVPTPSLPSPLPPSAGLAVAVLLGRTGAGAPVSIRSTQENNADSTGTPGHPGSIQSMFDLAAAHQRLLRDGGSHLLVTDPAARRGSTAFTLTTNTRNETENHAHQ